MTAPAEVEHRRVRAGRVAALDQPDQVGRERLPEPAVGDVLAERHRVALVVGVDGALSRAPQHRGVEELVVASGHGVRARRARRAARLRRSKIARDRLAAGRVDVGAALGPEQHVDARLVEDRLGRLQLRRRARRPAHARRSTRPARCPARSPRAARPWRSSATPARRWRRARAPPPGSRVRRSRHPLARTHSMTPATSATMMNPRPVDPTQDTTSAKGLSDWLSAALPHGNPPYGIEPVGRLAHDPETGDEQGQPRRGAPTARSSPGAPSGTRA